MAKNNNKQNAKADAKKVEIEKSPAKKADAKQADAKKDAKKADSKADAKKDAAKKQDVKKADKNKKPGLFERLKDYLHNVKLEMKRVTWPTKQEVINCSIIVVCTLIFFGVFIFLIDSGIVALLELYSKIG